MRKIRLRTIWLAAGLCGLSIALARCEETTSPQPGTAQVDRQAGGTPLARKSDDATADIVATFSIVAIDPETGVCGAAVASKYPAVGNVVPYALGGVGAFCTQHYCEPAFGPQALKLLEQDKSPSDILAELVREDRGAGGRQLAIIDRHGRTAQLNPIDAPERSRWWGAASGRFYACQGNTLTGSEVITAMAKAYETTEGSLADRLMAALVAGDQAGGDHRGRLAAGIVVDKPNVDKPNVGGDWLRLQVDKSDDAVTELAKKYAELVHEAKGAAGK